MEFITLIDALHGIADQVDPTTIAKADADAADAWRYSEAAALLHQSWVNHPTVARPRWVERDATTRKPLFSEAAAAEGLELLSHMSGWYRRRTSEFVNHIALCERFGLDHETTPRAIKPASGMLRWDRFTRYSEIGFERPALTSFLGQHGFVLRAVQPEQPLARIGSTETEPAAEHWKKKARRYALEDIESFRSRGATPIVQELADRVATRFRKEGVEGDKGPLSGATIKRHALKGIKNEKQR